MRMRNLWGAAVLAAAAWAGEVPRPAPPLEVPTLNGGKLSLQSLRGKVVLLKFFLTDCPHCQRSAGVIMPIYKEWKARGLEVVGVAINADAAQRIPDFVQRFGATYPMGIGSRTTVTTFLDVSVVYRFSVPYILMIDRQGVIRFEHPGDDTNFYNNEAHNIRLELEALLKEPAPAARKTPRKPSS